jgi:Cft2 family RNA processing exonuclease
MVKPALQNISTEKNNASNSEHVVPFVYAKKYNNNAPINSTMHIIVNITSAHCLILFLPSMSNNSEAKTYNPILPFDKNNTMLIRRVKIPIPPICIMPKRSNLPIDEKKQKGIESVPVEHSVEAALKSASERFMLVLLMKRQGIMNNPV